MARLDGRPRSTRRQVGSAPALDSLLRGCVVVLLLCVQVLSERATDCHSLLVKGHTVFAGHYQKLWGPFNGHAVYKGPRHKLFFAHAGTFQGWVIGRRTSNKGPYDERARGSELIASPTSHALRWHSKGTAVECGGIPAEKHPPAAFWKTLYEGRACEGTASFHVSVQRPKDCTQLMRDGTPACAQRGIACDHTTALGDCMVCARAWGWPYLRYDPLNKHADERCSYMKRCELPISPKKRVAIYQAKSVKPTPAPTPVRTRAPTPKPGECVVGAWKAQTKCSKVCGGGFMDYSRHILHMPAPGIGKACPTLMAKRPCNDIPCDKTDAPTPAPTPKATPAPTPQPTRSPTPKPTPSPTPKPCHLDYIRISGRHHGQHLYGTYHKMPLIVNSRPVYKHKRDRSSKLDTYLFYTSDEHLEGWVLAHGMSRLDRMVLAVESKATVPEQVSGTWFTPPAPWGTSDKKRMLPSVHVFCAAAVTKKPTLAGWQSLEFKAKFKAMHKAMPNAKLQETTVYFTLQLIGITPTQVRSQRRSFMSVVSDSIGVPTHFITVQAPRRVLKRNTAFEGTLLNVALRANAPELCDQVGKKFCTAAAMLGNLKDPAFLGYFQSNLAKEGFPVRPLPKGIRLSLPFVRESSGRHPGHTKLGSWDAGTKQRVAGWEVTEAAAGWASSEPSGEALFDPVHEGTRTSRKPTAGPLHSSAGQAARAAQIGSGQTDDEAGDPFTQPGGRGHKEQAEEDKGGAMSMAVVALALICGASIAKCRRRCKKRRKRTVHGVGPEKRRRSGPSVGIDEADTYFDYSEDDSDEDSGGEFLDGEEEDDY